MTTVSRRQYVRSALTLDERPATLPNARTDHGDLGHRDPEATRAGREQPEPSRLSWPSRQTADRGPNRISWHRARSREPRSRQEPTGRSGPILWSSWLFSIIRDADNTIVDRHRTRRSLGPSRENGCRLRDNFGIFQQAKIAFASSPKLRMPPPLPICRLPIIILRINNSRC
jgi:hypothetical protein